MHTAQTYTRQHATANRLLLTQHFVSASPSKLQDAAAEHRQPFPALTTASTMCWEPVHAKRITTTRYVSVRVCKRVLCSIGSSVGSGEAATAHLSASETRVELEEVGVGSDLGQVPLHGAHGVSR